MRRPTPIPASEEPEEAPAEGVGRAPRRGFRARRSDAGPVAPAETPEETAVEADTDSDSDSTITAVIEDTVPVRVPPSAERADASAGKNDDENSAVPVRSADVWRAARARRKALRAEIRRFTQRSRRRRLIWWGSIGAVVALVLGSVIAAYSPLFAVEKITIAGTKSLDAATVQQALDGQIGSPLALVDSSAVKAALTEFPLIESYALEARPPHELLVRIVERTPVGVLKSGGGYTLVDAAGVVLATTPQRPEGQPLLSLSGGVDAPGFRSAGLVIRSLPAELRAQVTEVRAKSADDVTIVLQDGKSVMWGSEDDSATKAIVLVALIKKAPKADYLDVSAPTVPVVR